MNENPATQKRTRRALLIIIALVLAIAASLAVLFQNQARTLLTLKKVDDYPLYVMRYYGDYGFSDFLQRGMRASARPGSYGQEREAVPACTCFAAPQRGGGMLLGRNFDWLNRPALVLFTRPPDGYASVSMVDVSYLGFMASRAPSWRARRQLLEAPYWPFDGMNEAGLAVGMMAVPHARDSQDPQKVTIASLHAIRLLLDYAGDVQEAISLLQDYNLDFRGPPLHYLIADASGRSAVVEFVNGETIVLRNDRPWQVATNFVLSEQKPQGATSDCWRYNRAYEALERAEGQVSTQEAMALLQGVSQEITMWSAVYEMASGEMSVVVGRAYDRVHTFQLR